MELCGIATTSIPFFCCEDMLHYTKHILDSEKAWVTFIHGAGGSSTIWYKQLDDFRQQFNVLLIDLRGHGRSQSPIYEKMDYYTFEDIGNDIIDVLDHLQIKTTHFIGISLGTIIIRDITHRFPERTSSMVMGGAVIKLNVRGQILMKLGVLLQKIVPFMWLYRLFALIIMPRRKHRKSRDIFVREARRMYHREFRRWFTLTREINSVLSFFRKNPLHKPTLYLMGSEDFMFLPSIRKIVQRQKSSKLEVIPECGHVVNIERAGAFNASALRFLEEIMLTNQTV